MNRQRPNLIAALLGIALSLAYIWQARSIEDSLLADEVGAGGVPTGVGLLLLVASVVLLVRSLMVGSPAAQIAQVAQDTRKDNEGQGGRAQHPHRMALGLLAILGGYVALLPVAGYVLSIGLLSIAVVRFSGGALDRTVAAFALAIGPLLWFLFSYLLQVRMPVGLWSGVLGG